MEISGERRIAASREKVWRALSDGGFAGAALPGFGRVEQAGPESWRVVSGDADLLIRPGQVEPPASAEATLSGAAEGRASLALAEEGAFTRLVWRAEGERVERLRPGIEAVLDRLSTEVAGPEPVGAEATGHAIQAVSQAGGWWRAIPESPLGVPLVAWIGGALFLFIFVNLFGPYF